MEVAQALELNGYKFRYRRILSKLGHVAKVYENTSGVEMYIIDGSRGAMLGSENTDALDFILEILNGAYAG